MPVYNQHRVLHIHIPKTGGTAITTLFRRAGDVQQLREQLYGEFQDEGRWFELHHATAREIDRRTQGRFRGYATFAVVRNPYQRLISDFLWRARVSHNPASDTVRQFDDFRSFVRSIPIDIDRAWQDHIHGADRAWANLLIHTRPQHHFVSDESGRLDPSIETIRFEQLPDVTSTVLDACGVDTTPLRRPRNRRIADYFDTDLLARTNEIYAQDFEQFGYPRIQRVIRT